MDKLSIIDMLSKPGINFYSPLILNLEAYSE